MKIKSLAYGLQSSTRCYECAQETPVYALGSDTIYDEEVGWLAGSADAPELYLLTQIETLPEVLLTLVSEGMGEHRQVFFKSRDEYQNHCIHCGAVQGDWYTQSEAGGAFFPATMDAARAISLVTLPLTEEVYVDASYGVGGATLILDVHRPIAPMNIVQYYGIQLVVGQQLVQFEYQQTKESLYLGPHCRVAGLSGMAHITSQALAHRFLEACAPKLQKKYPDGVEFKIASWEATGSKDLFNRIAADSAVIEKRLDTGNFTPNKKP
jgi:hypothetical protein